MEKGSVSGSYDEKLKKWTKHFSDTMSDLLGDYAPLRGNITSVGNGDVRLHVLCSDVNGTFQLVEVVMDPNDKEIPVHSASGTFYKAIGTHHLKTSNKDEYKRRNQKAFRIIRSLVDEYIACIEDFPYSINSVLFDADITKVRSCKFGPDKMAPECVTLYIISHTPEYLDDICIVDARDKIERYNGDEEILDIWE